METRNKSFLEEVIKIASDVMNGKKPASNAQERIKRTDFSKLYDGSYISRLSN
jgi:hypothetical protein